MKESKGTSILAKLNAIAGQILRLSADVKLSDYATKDGATISVDDETLEVQGEVQDGEYELEDGRILVITGGKLDTIKDAPVAEDAAAETQDTQDAQPSELDALKAENEQLQAKVAELEKALAEATDSKSKLSAKLSEIESKPADKKISLSAQTNAEKSPAQIAWERYNKK